MIRNTHRTWFEVWGAEEAQNKILKLLLTLSIFLNGSLVVALSVMHLKGPTLIALSNDETRVVKPTGPGTGLLGNEIRRVAASYLDARHTWEWAHIEESFRRARAYVEPSFSKKFDLNVASEIKLARLKKISQRFYPGPLRVDTESKTVRVEGDRIILIDSLHAANSLKLTLYYDFGPRTEMNPEGVYIVSEALNSPSGGIEPLGDGK